VHGRLHAIPEKKVLQNDHEWLVLAANFKENESKGKATMLMIIY